jgi:DNA-binding NtrC family response regulator
MSDDRRPLSEPNDNLRFGLDGVDNHGMLGTSAPMQALFVALSRTASSSAPLLIRGEPGTGKELIARAVHAHSDHAGRPCFTVDCKANQEPQVQASLPGVLQVAEGGTVILAGIDGLSIDLQTRLLRVLRGGHVDGMDAGRGRPDVRIISTAGPDLERFLEQGRFRKSLYQQLNVMDVEAPPLRERGGDVQLLADYFLERFTTAGSRRRVVGFSAEARQAMQDWAWPGNVRELQDRVRKAIVLCERGPLCSSDLELETHAQDRFPLTLEEALGAAGS